MKKPIYNRISECLDIFVDRLSELAALIPGAGLLNGKTGTALLLYEYAAYRGDEKMREHADRLIDLALSEITPEAGFDLESGLSGTAWGVDYLLKRGFVQADEDIFEEIDNELFKKKDEMLYLYGLGPESERALYVLRRLDYDKSSGYEIWLRRAGEYLQSVREIMNLRYTAYALPVFTCRDLFLFFHVCDMFRKRGVYLSQTDFLYNELREIVIVSRKEEKNNATRYMSDQLLMRHPIFADHIPIGAFRENATLTEVIDFYQVRLITGRVIPTPEFIDNALYGIVEDQNRIDELLYLLNPRNAGLGNYAGGLAWAMLNWCMEHDKKNK